MKLATTIPLTSILSRKRARRRTNRYARFMLNAFFQHLIDQTVINRIRRAQEIVAIRVALYRFHRLTGVNASI